MFSFFLTMLPALAAADTCRLALILALDVSGSVNEVEYAQQLNGVAFALQSPSVKNALLADVGAPVDLAVFEWSSRNHQFVIQPWITLDSHAAIDQASLRIRSYQKKRAGLKTALSTALLFASDLFQTKQHCWRLKIDVSGDGKNNIGPELSQVYRLPAFSRITVNALVVGDPAPTESKVSDTAEKKAELQAYFERDVILGADAFAMIAHGYEDYARAMEEKLLREIEVPVLGAASQ